MLLFPVHYNWVVNQTRTCSSRLVMRNNRLRTVTSCSPYRSTPPPAMTAADGVSIPFPRQWARRDEYRYAESVSVTIAMEIPATDEDVTDGSDAVDYMGDVTNYDCLIHIHRPDLNTFFGAIPRSREDIPGALLFWGRAATVAGAVVSVLSSSRIAIELHRDETMSNGVRCEYLFIA